jgi:hypothetical protein
MADGHHYPDVVLTAIPLTLVVAYGAGTLLDARLVVATAAVGICYFLMADGLFWHGPSE